MEKGHAEKVHSTYENHNENIGKKTTQYVKTTLSKTAKQGKLQRQIHVTLFQNKLILIY